MMEPQGDELQLDGFSSEPPQQGGVRLTPSLLPTSYSIEPEKEWKPLWMVSYLQGKRSRSPYY